MIRLAVATGVLAVFGLIGWAIVARILKDKPKEEEKQTKQ